MQLRPWTFLNSTIHPPPRGVLPFEPVRDTITVRWSDDAAAAARAEPAESGKGKVVWLPRGLSDVQLKAGLDATGARTARRSKSVPPARPHGLRGSASVGRCGGDLLISSRRARPHAGPSPRVHAPPGNSRVLHLESADQAFGGFEDEREGAAARSRRQTVTISAGGAPTQRWPRQLPSERPNEPRAAATLAPSSAPPGGEFQKQISNHLLGGFSATWCCTSWDKPRGTITFKRPNQLATGAKARAGVSRGPEVPAKRQCYWRDCDENGNQK